MTGSLCAKTRPICRKILEDWEGMEDRNSLIGAQVDRAIGKNSHAEKGSLPYSRQQASGL
jgi:hypothetical protein